jgi:peptidoglycan hydrolase-like protein with peptidoglycan-binding domain
MSGILRPIDIATARKLSRGVKGADVLLLHALLNHHLGPPDDQLPVEGPEAEVFGPRTEAKVKKFQEINRIDIGTPYFKDGVVGQHTWQVLNEAQLVTLDVLATPTLKLNPPTFPDRPNNFPPPSPRTLPVPKLTLDDNLGFAIQVQAGEQGTFPLTGGGVTGSHALQVVAIMLKKKDQDSFHPELQLGPTVLANRGPGADSKTDLGFLAILNLANMPGSAGRFNWSIQSQLALLKSLSNRGGSGQLSILGAANLNIIKDGSLQATTQLGPVFEADPPTSDNGNKWGLKAGVSAFFGLTGTLNLFEPH